MNDVQNISVGPWKWISFTVDNRRFYEIVFWFTLYLYLEKLAQVIFTFDTVKSEIIINFSMCKSSLFFFQICFCSMTWLILDAYLYSIYWLAVDEHFSKWAIFFLSRISSSHLRLRVVCVSIRFQNECADRNFDRVKR